MTPELDLSTVNKGEYEQFVKEVVNKLAKVNKEAGYNEVNAVLSKGLPAEKKQGYGLNQKPQWYEENAKKYKELAIYLKNLLEGVKSLDSENFGEKEHEKLLEYQKKFIDVFQKDR